MIKEVNMYRLKLFFSWQSDINGNHETIRKALVMACDTIKEEGTYFERFKDLDLEGQIKYSKLLLQTIFKYWQKLERDSFNEYAAGLFSNPEIPYLKIFDKLIDGTDDAMDIVRFVVHQESIILFKYIRQIMLGF